MDGRVCSQCSCGNPSGASCSAGKYTFFTDPICFLGALDAKAGCQQMSPNGSAGESVYYSPGQVTQGAACPATGGAPGGAFKGTGEVTLCCKE
jgi:hypothetical protein